MKTVIKAEIVAHSINEQGDELISVLVTMPRIILSEMNTHRMLSKNTSSSRAIPFNKMLEAEACTFSQLCKTWGIHIKTIRR